MPFLFAATERCVSITPGSGAAVRRAGTGRQAARPARRLRLQQHRRRRRLDQERKV